MPPSTGGGRCGGTLSSVWRQLIAAPPRMTRLASLPTVTCCCGRWRCSRRGSARCWCCGTGRTCPRRRSPECWAAAWARSRARRHAALTGCVSWPEFPRQAIAVPRRRCRSAMSDFERQLREAMRTAVADAQPPPSAMESVRRRYWRRRIWLAAASVVAVAMLVAVVPVAGAVGGGGGRPAHGRISGAPLFPGGGRLLLDRHGALEWLYPHGRTVRLASGFAGPAPAGGNLLAWKHANPPGAPMFLPHGCFGPDCTRIHDLSYYTMNLDGSDARLILPAESPVGNIAFQYQDAQLSPDGSRLASTSQDLRNGTRNIFLDARELWPLDPATGQRTELGPASTPFTWKDNATILADSADGRSIQQIDARDGTRTTYLTVDDPSLIHAYERARPGSGHPAFVGLGGWSPGASALAVTLNGRTRLGSNTGQPAEILMARGRVSAFAPVHYPSILRTMKWGPNGGFLLEAQR